MAKKVEACTCPICGSGLCKICAVVALIVGVCFLLQDLVIWNFWNISWYTAAFIIIGLFSLFIKK
ncbi:hypothetical protein KY332_01125 [Candidatus Woesearchaeota archaeon]|nr:hypothetical protein [Candidatus Woesearchaeota archaeon]